MSKVLVIGYGNPFRGDDGVGFRVAEQLDNDLSHICQQKADVGHPEIEVVATQELKPELIESASRADLVIFIDAVAEGEPGTVRQQETGPEENYDGVFSHELTPSVLLAAANVIYERCPRAVMISVAGQEFGFSTHMTPAVDASQCVVFDRIRELIAAVPGTPCGSTIQQ